ncbi:threonine synthase [Varunaivibrio sulfuroxidans]|uniref:Threonine synthase n=1 Tax=Varunaivibrio sulfuroxidans TaxID=1773489 RepID=A0A4R3JC45_9PROT|nr:threonine synthase [Varunaivibrio sulfuroxidans]TCS62653.1 L-threonine synthase [Varunaivibrio sulfuroxidans]WES30681.1 threonine synthase [Varunaivibrio sulfuroxidans]
MKYISTRGQAPALSFDDVLLSGLGRDGGLYVPETWPRFTPQDIAAMARMNYRDVAAAVIAPFVEGAIGMDDLKALIETAYENFDDPEIAPLKRLSDDEWLLELFHGPTLAFKDVALQFLGGMFDHVLGERGSKITVVGATSGDTGSAAIAACRDKDSIEIFILHPEGRVSDVQRRQMTTVLSKNVHNIAFKGNFDDCQNAVKALFNDLEFRDRIHLSAVNSINWVRIMAQIVYYFWAATRIGAPEKKIQVAVPTGNFGNIFAAYGARKMGLGIEKFIIGSNSNDILIRFIRSGKMTPKGVRPTISPSMDIQISSNFERLLFEVCDRDPARVRAFMADFRDKGEYAVPPEIFKKITDLFDGEYFDDAETKGIMRAVYVETGELLDPHTAIGVGAARAVREPGDAPVICLATAHPAKFPDAVHDACGVYPELPKRLADLMTREERADALDNDLDVLREYIVHHIEPQ